MTNRDVVIEAVRGLPEDASIERIRDEVALALQLCTSMEQADRGEVISHDELVREVQAWTATSTR